MRLCPLATFEQIDPTLADARLALWGHYLGPCTRPFGRQDFGLIVGNELIACATTATAVNESVEGDLGRWSAGLQVRRLTPRECERLQGFPDDYTLIPYGKSGRLAQDGPRYKALGNSMAVPVMRWIGRRIALVERIASELSL